MITVLTTRAKRRGNRVEHRFFSVLGLASGVVPMSISSIGREGCSSIRGVNTPLPITSLSCRFSSLSCRYSSLRCRFSSLSCLNLSTICCGVIPSNWSGFNSLSSWLSHSTACCGVIPSSWSGFSSPTSCGGVSSCIVGVDMITNEVKYKCEFCNRFMSRDQITDRSRDDILHRGCSVV
ncbi:predicted protein [Meyerozyma guilliermondii ATCC 6260]|uniref:Uncharacterized protein n=1 Tax=Meyerozyma guilliermondii (strain ATCC 6260 / CBS 566 / DSM 6381 / JCM 1539 / NBRC 10279 / NRRL Y-324) TaxID=294746 RepID=A5DKV6_PICGU|nr:uncharacterized protein PGUG_03907 [Meyerozyma guilliermondii ATCC 6260]EDK39808.1 predicted protein [Meyerozyma guilliermondii ATCC 6260]